MMILLRRLRLFHPWRDSQRVDTVDDSPCRSQHLYHGDQKMAWDYCTTCCSLEEIRGTRPHPVDVFTLRELQEATDNFCSSNFLGEGGFGRVYRGILKNGQVVAIKQMDCPTTRRVQEGEREFRLEVDILSSLNHPNLVRLIGYCADKCQRLLVYEFMAQGNLQETLHGILRIKTDWPTRVTIALDSARGLCHLHNGSGTRNPIIHRDFKSSNILLDKNLKAKVSDFGLAKLVPFDSKPYVSTRVLGTFGYMDPQYIATGHVTLKSDVYGFGVVLLELLTGRRPVDTCQALHKQNLVSQVKDKLRCRRKLKRVIDPELSRTSYSMDSIACFAALASRCVKDDSRFRPTMAECVKELEQILFYSLLKSS